MDKKNILTLKKLKTPYQEEISHFFNGIKEDAVRANPKF
jgi:hypothetical protein